MKNDLMKLVNGERRPITAEERKAARAGREVVAEVQLASIEADGAFALAAHIMRGAQELDEQRRSLVGSDPLLAMLLGDIEACAVRQVKRIQANLYTQW